MQRVVLCRGWYYVTYHYNYIVRFYFYEHNINNSKDREHVC